MLHTKMLSIFPFLPKNLFTLNEISHCEVSITRGSYALIICQEGDEYLYGKEDSLKVTSESNLKLAVVSQLLQDYYEYQAKNIFDIHKVQEVLDRINPERFFIYEFKVLDFANPCWSITFTDTEFSIVFDGEVIETHSNSQLNLAIVIENILKDELKNEIQYFSKKAEEYHQYLHEYYEFLHKIDKWDDFIEDIHT